MAAPWLVVAIGNASRGDDALGPALAARLAETAAAAAVHEDREDQEVHRAHATARADDAHGADDAGGALVEIVERYQLQLEDLLLLQGRRGVLFVDAARTPAEPTCRPLAPAAGATAFTHALAPAVLLGLYRRVLGADPPPSWLLPLPGRQWELGAPLSDLGRRSLDAGWTAARAWIGQRTTCVEESARPPCSTAPPSPCCARPSTGRPAGSCAGASAPMRSRSRASPSGSAARSQSRSALRWRASR